MDEMIFGGRERDRDNKRDRLGERDRRDRRRECHDDGDFDDSLLFFFLLLVIIFSNGFKR